MVTLTVDALIRLSLEWTRFIFSMFFAAAVETSRFAFAYSDYMSDMIIREIDFRPGNVWANLVSDFKNEDFLWKSLICKFDVQDFRRDIFRFTISVDSAVKSLNVENFKTRSFDVFEESE